MFFFFYVTKRTNQRKENGMHKCVCRLQIVKNEKKKIYTIFISIDKKKITKKINFFYK